MPDNQPDPVPEVAALPEAIVEPAPEPAPAQAEPGSDALYDWSRHLPEPEQQDAPPLPTHKDDLVALAIDAGVPSYTAWAMTVPALTKKLKG